MNPDEIMVDEIIEMLKNDLNELQQFVDEIKKDNLDKKKLGEAYFAVQKIQMELYKLYSLTS